MSTFASHPLALPGDRHRVRVMGVALDPLTELDTIAIVLNGVQSGHGGWVCPVNLDVLRKVVRDPAVRGLVEQADVVTADGMPLLWAGRLQRSPLPARVAGSSLIRTLPTAACRAGASVFLLGGDPGVAEAAAAKLREADPQLRVATHCPPLGFEHSPQALDAIERALAAERPDVVFVGLGFPKQERLILRLRPRFPAAWFVSCGISFSFVSGDVRRAPAWVQRIGMEWLHRLVQEPRRLARRYLLEGIPFLMVVLAGALRRRLSATSGGA